MNSIFSGFWQKIGLWQGSTHIWRKNSRPRLWFHAVSVGELNAIRPLLDALPTDAIEPVISTTTPTAQRLAAQRYPQLLRFYFPFDFPWSVAAALRVVQPDMVALVETELWPVFIAAASRRCPVWLINARVSDRSYGRFLRLRPWVSGMLGCLDAVWAQSRQDAQRLEALGAPAVTQAGNLKFDVPATVDPQQRAELERLFNWQIGVDPVLVFASTHIKEEGPLLDVYVRLLKTFPTLKLVLAPRHPDRLPEVQAHANGHGLRFIIRSQLTPQLAKTRPNQAPVVLLDTIGELRSLYAMADVAVIGGSFNPKRGGQNPLEALALGKPVVFGPHMANFREVVSEILTAGAGVQVPDTEALYHTLYGWLQAPATAQAVGARGHALMAQHQGAAARLAEAMAARLVADFRHSTS
jgi:3-deoxy-D-manno-octulosonic-acid transferase